LIFTGNIKPNRHFLSLKSVTGPGLDFAHTKSIRSAAYQNQRVADWGFGKLRAMYAGEQNGQPMQ